MIKLLPIAVATILLTSCTASQSPVDTTDASIYRRWILTRTSGGFTGTVKDYPDRNLSLWLTADGNAIRYDRDSVVSRTAFTMEYGPSIVMSDSAHQVRYANEPVTQIIARLTRDTLILIDNVYDGTTHIYERGSQGTP